MTEPKQPKLTKSLLWLMIFSACFVVANNYYNQPLLAEIARDFNIKEELANGVATITLLGYAFGLFLLVPLGDKLNKRILIIGSFILIIASLLCFALSTGIYMLMISGFVIGLSSVIPQMYVPLAAQLSAPGSRSKNVGLVMTGLLIGILGARILSGLLGGYMGWRFVFYIAAGIMFILFILNLYLLPTINPTFKGSYGSLMKSIVVLIKNRPDLRHAALRGALSLASFQAFWTTLTFYIEQKPFDQGSEMAGLLSIVAIGGALSASYVGKIADSSNKKHLLIFASFCMIVAWIFLGFTSWMYVGLVLGIFILDIGLQSLHVTNQSIIFSKDNNATNRINTVYMTCYFVGGALGSYLGGIAWNYFQWMGVVGIGLLFGLLLLVSILINNKKESF